VTPFGRQVNASIAKGIQWLRDTQGADGRWGGGGDQRGSTGWCLLALLEQPTGPDWGAPAKGYNGLDAADQERARRAAKYLVSLQLVNDARFYAYGTGEIGRAPV